MTAIKNRRLIPFIGAGFSKNVNPSFPDWSQLVPICAKFLDHDPDILSSQGNFLQIAEFLDENDQLETFYNHMSLLMDGGGHDVSASMPHRLLPYIDAPYIFTTNWDKWIEEGFVNEGVPYTKIAKYEDLIRPRLVIPDIGSPVHTEAERKLIRSHFPSSTIVKYHGDFSNQSEIVFTESDYFGRMNFDHPFDIRLRSEILGRSVLFVGYSFSDQNVRYIWHKLVRSMERIPERIRPTSFFVTHKDSPLQTDILKATKVEVVLVDPLDIGGGVTKLFERIIEIQRKP